MDEIELDDSPLAAAVRELEERKKDEERQLKLFDDWELGERTCSVYSGECESCQ